MPRQADSGRGAGEPQVPDRQPVGTDRGRASWHRRPSRWSRSCESSGLELSDILRRGSHSWTRLRQDAGLETLPGSELEEKLLKRVRAFAHVDDPQRATPTASLLADGCPRYAELSPATSRRSHGCCIFSLWSDGGGFDSHEEGLDALRDENGRLARVWRRVVDLSFDAARHRALGLPGPLADVPLQVHARYQREEILAALDFPARIPTASARACFYFADAQRGRLLRHAEEVRGRLLAQRRCTPTTRSARRCSTGSRSRRPRSAPPPGSATSTGPARSCCSCRQEPKDDFGTSPYLFLGPATLRLPHRRPTDRDHLAARSRDADRLLHTRQRSRRKHSRRDRGITAGTWTCRGRARDPPRRTIQPMAHEVVSVGTESGPRPLASALLQDQLQPLVLPQPSHT